MIEKLCLIGQTFGDLTVLAEGRRRPIPSGQKPRRWICHCACGNFSCTTTGQLRSGRSRSCGCLISKTVIKRCTKHGFGTRKNKCVEYRTWKAMRKRCSNPKFEDFKYYGGRGIKVCDRWNEFTNFYADMGPRPSSTHSIDRIDVNGNYEPTNCRWATPTEQSRNRRNVKSVSA